MVEVPVDVATMMLEAGVNAVAESVPVGLMLWGAFDVDATTGVVSALVVLATTGGITEVGVGAEVIERLSEAVTAGDTDAEAEAVSEIVGLIGDWDTVALGVVIGTLAVGEIVALTPVLMGTLTVGETVTGVESEMGLDRDTVGETTGTETLPVPTSELIGTATELAMEPMSEVTCDATELTIEPMSEVTCAGTELANRSNIRSYLRGNRTSNRGEIRR